MKIAGGEEEDKEGSFKYSRVHLTLYSERCFPEISTGHS